MRNGIENYGMTKVAFWYDAPAAYTGGLNYVRNLLYAVSLVGDSNIEFYVFFGKKTDESLIARFRPYAKIVQTAVLDRKSLPWFINKILFKFFNSVLLPSIVLRKYAIDVVSHVENIYGRHSSYKVIGWIPDFQYLHLPELFPGLVTEAESGRFREMIRASDLVVLSSNDALNDFKKIAPPGFAERGRVVPFVSQPDSKLYLKDAAVTVDILEKKYGFNGKFFFLPNQFWAHKNHMVVLEAVRLLKQKGKETLVICTGNLYDYRLNNTSYADGLKRFIASNGLQNNIKVLGLIDYNEVLCLMKNALAVLNPSRFEGWSSVVEEAKSIGKTVILSKISVHVEQNPTGGKYFDPDDADALSRILAEVWDATVGNNDSEQQQKAREQLYARTIAYGKAYLGIVHEVLGLEK
jgi:hypothetical protein